jgi:hypothetical protein
VQKSIFSGIRAVSQFQAIDLHEQGSDRNGQNFAKAGFLVTLSNIILALVAPRYIQHGEPIQYPANGTDYTTLNFPEYWTKR